MLTKCITRTYKCSKSYMFEQSKEKFPPFFVLQKIYFKLIIPTIITESNEIKT